MQLDWKGSHFSYDTHDIPYIGLPTTESSDSDDDLVIVRRPALPWTEASTSNKENEKEKEKEHSFLPSPSPSTVAGNQHTPASSNEGAHELNDPSLQSDDDFQEASEKPPTPQPAKRSRAPTKPSIQEENIIENRTRTIRKQTELGKAYVLQQIDGANIFHAAFAAHIAAPTFYEGHSPPESFKPLAAGTRYHRDQIASPSS
ncbi:MAG: hypothetical protein L6R36_008405 [Xanthoria steineri]|nr:MAG: hypothetical protein L6R36_008405 [Xanthoria steineri]